MPVVADGWLELVAALVPLRRDQLLSEDDRAPAPRVLPDEYGTACDHPEIGWRAIS
jgi:hypothetical protein